MYTNIKDFKWLKNEQTLLKTQVKENNCIQRKERKCLNPNYTGKIGINMICFYPWVVLGFVSNHHYPFQLSEQVKLLVWPTDPSTRHTQSISGLSQELKRSKRHVTQQFYTHNMFSDKLVY